LRHAVARQVPSLTARIGLIIGSSAGLGSLALICAERTRQTRRFQSSSAPRVLLSPQGQRRQLERRRAVTCNYAERRRAGSSPALVF